MCLFLLCSFLHFLSSSFAQLCILSWQIRKSPLSFLHHPALHPSGVAKLSTSFGWGQGRECHLCRVAGNTVLSHVACEFPSGVATLRTAIHLLLTYLFQTALLTNGRAEHRKTTTQERRMHVSAQHKNVISCLMFHIFLAFLFLFASQCRINRNVLTAKKRSVVQPTGTPRMHY